MVGQEEEVDLVQLLYFIPLVKSSRLPRMSGIEKSASAQEPLPKRQFGNFLILIQPESTFQPAHRHFLS